MYRASAIALAASLVMGCSLLTSFDGLTSSNPSTGGADSVSSSSKSSSHAGGQSASGSSAVVGSTGGSPEKGGGGAGGVEKGGGGEGGRGGASQGNGGSVGDVTSSSSGVTDPCVHGAYYCGGDKVTGNPSSLYKCEMGNQGALVQACPHGCLVRSGGHDDSCKCLAGGFYCGGDDVEGNANDLYKCKADGTGTLQQSCPNGCKVNPNADDSCVTNPR